LFDQKARTPRALGSTREPAAIVETCTSVSWSGIRARDHLSTLDALSPAADWLSSRSRCTIRAFSLRSCATSRRASAISCAMAGRMRPSFWILSARASVSELARSGAVVLMRCLALIVFGPGSVSLLPATVARPDGGNVAAEIDRQSRQSGFERRFSVRLWAELSHVAPEPILRVARLLETLLQQGLDSFLRCWSLHRS
jgi:hypothetical protein